MEAWTPVARWLEEIKAFLTRCPSQVASQSRSRSQLSCSPVAHLRLRLRLASSSNEKSMCPIQFEQIQFENAGRTPGPQLASTSGTAARRLSLARHGALLMSFYCASGVLIAAIFNLIYAPVAQPTRWPTIDFTIKRGKDGEGKGEGEGEREECRPVSISQCILHVFACFAHLFAKCLMARMCSYVHTPPSLLPLFPSSILPPFPLFVCAGWRVLL